MIQPFLFIVTFGVCVLILDSEHVPLSRIGLWTEIAFSRIMTNVSIILWEKDNFMLNCLKIKFWSCTRLGTLLYCARLIPICTIKTETKKLTISLFRLKKSGKFGPNNHQNSVQSISHQKSSSQVTPQKFQSLKWRNLSKIQLPFQTILYKWP